jgi:hypothetical protein
VGRDALIGPGLAELDFFAAENAAITEKMNLQFRAEFFNILNRANCGTPNPVVFHLGLLHSGSDGRRNHLRRDNIQANTIRVEASW